MKFLYTVPQPRHLSVTHIHVKALSVSAVPSSLSSSISSGYSYVTSTEKLVPRHFMHSTFFLCVCAGCPLPHFSYPSQLLSKTGISLPHFLQRAFNASLSFSGSRYNLENTPHLISPSVNTSKSCEAQQVSVPFISSLPSLFFRHDTSKNGRIFQGSSPSLLA